VHLVAWLNDVRPKDVPALIQRAEAAGIGLYSVAPYYTQPQARGGLLFGYSSLSEAAIRAGIRKLAALLA
jgi:GntR family transcriptional regulator/MocR family aminotransferase